MTAKPTARSRRAGKTAKQPKLTCRDKSPQEHGREYQERLLRNIKERLPQLEKLLREAEGCLASQEDRNRAHELSSEELCQWQSTIRDSHVVLQELLPDRPIKTGFGNLAAQAAGQECGSTVSKRWKSHSRLHKAMVYVFHYLSLTCRKGRELEAASAESDQDWEVLLRLYDLE